MSSTIEAAMAAKGDAPGAMAAPATPQPAGKKIGDVILDVKNISLSFGGVKALTDISFNVREHEIRAIIGPNGAGKSSMLNCINGVYTPQQGSISFKGQTFSHMNSRQVATMGIARTFQNLALFKGMSVIDNIMTGRNLRIRSNLFLQALRIGPAEREEIAHREFVERIIRSSPCSARLATSPSSAARSSG